MGIFSSKKKTQVGTSVSRLIEDDQLPETINAGILSGLLRDEDIVSHMMEGLVSGPALRMERMFAYAKKHYTYGLPNSNLVTETTGADIVQAVLARELGGTVELEYFRVGAVNSSHIAWQTLIEQYAYDLESNQIGSLSEQMGVPVYLKEFYPILPTEIFEGADTGALDPWGDPSTAGYAPDRPAQIDRSVGMYRKPSPVVVDETAEHEVIVFVYSYVENGVIQTGEFRVSLASFETENDYYQAKYLHTLNGQTRTGFWTYEDGTGLYPEVDLINNIDYSKVGTYFPFLFFRHNRQNRASDVLKHTEAYRTTKKALSYLNIDFQTMSDEIHANPDIDEVEQAVLMFAVPAVTQDESERRYLFDYFNTLFHIRPRANNRFADDGLFGRISSVIGEMLGASIVIQDADFKVSLGYRGIGKRRVQGSIGRVGSHDSGIGSETRTEQYQKTLIGQNRFESATRTVATKYLYYRRQVTPFFYEEILVAEPKLQYAIWRGYSTVAGIDDGNLLIPLDRAITKTYPLTVREKLYPRSMHFVFNSRVTTKVKWYESSFFKFILTAVAVVVTFLSAGAAWQTLMVAAAVGVGALAYVVFMYVLKAVIFNYAFKLFVKEVGAEIAFIAAIVSAVVGIGGGIKGAPWAQATLTVSTGLSGGIQTENARLMAEYNKDLSEFNLFVEEANKELDTAKNLLSNGISIDPFEFIGRGPLVVWGESPNDFYQRTVHSGNIGVVGIDAIQHYVDISLELPDMTRSDATFDA